MANNILYEDKDVTVKLMGDDSLDAFLADAIEKVQTQKPAACKVKGKKPKEEPEPEPRTPIWDRVFGRSYGLYDHYDL
jgi:hypothetical protein